MNWERKLNTTWHINIQSIKKKYSQNIFLQFLGGNNRYLKKKIYFLYATVVFAAKFDLLLTPPRRMAHGEYDQMADIRMMLRRRRHRARIKKRLGGCFKDRVRRHWYQHHYNHCMERKGTKEPINLIWSIKNWKKIYFLFNRKFRINYQCRLRERHIIFLAWMFECHRWSRWLQQSDVILAFLLQKKRQYIISHNF